MIQILKDIKRCHKIIKSKNLKPGNPGYFYAFNKEFIIVSSWSFDKIPS